MAQYLCPHCRNPLDIPTSLAGSVVDCEMCGGQVTIPAMALATYTPEPPMQAQPQFIVVNTPSPRYQPRLKSGGWFARSFASAFGVLMAIVAVGLTLAIVFVFCVVMFFQAASAYNQRNQPPAKVSVRR